MHWRRKWQPTPVFLPGEPQGRQSLVGHRLWGRTESDTTEAATEVAANALHYYLLHLKYMFEKFKDFLASERLAKLSTRTLE